LALSPDLSPIAYLWDDLVRRVHHRQSPPETVTTGVAWRTCARVKQHHTSYYPTIDWFYASEMWGCRCCKRWSHTLLNSADLHAAWQFLSVHDLFW
jgi:hypothetical protein